MKLVANTMYGYTSANFSGRMPLSELACAIVADSRLCTEVAIDAVKDKFGFSTVYGDTDSLFVDLEQPLTKVTIIFQSIIDCFSSDNNFDFRKR